MSLISSCLTFPVGRNNLNNSMIEFVKRSLLIIRAERRNKATMRLQNEEDGEEE